MPGVDPTGMPTTTGDPGMMDPDVDDPTTACVETPPIGQRLIRLNYTQLATTFAALLGPEAIAGLTLADPRHREFQPLFSVEGPTVTTQVLQRSLEIARAAAESVTPRFTEVTGCASPATDECAQQFLTDLAAQAFRRPVTPDEQTSIDDMYAEVKAQGLSVEAATEYAIQGVLLAPATLYRTEFGTPAGNPAEARLDPYEIASALSYFLTDGPPDDMLLAAAADGSLGDEAGEQVQVDRLLGTPEARANLTAVMMAYYRLGEIDEVIKSETVFPDTVFNVGLRNSMYTETQMFLEQVLWQGTVTDLLTSTDTFLNEPLAMHYGVTYPAQAGGDPVQDFVPVSLPEGQRSGILTQASIMTMRSVPDTTSVVGRGLFVNGAFLCLQRPEPPPDGIQEQVERQLMNTAETEREKADYRAETSPCLTCHALMDPYGLVLENYDAIGRYRTMYDGGTAIDTATTTPTTMVNAAADRGVMLGDTLANVSEFVTAMDSSGLFSRCMTANLLKYAAAAPVVDADECVVDEVHDAYQAGEPTFGSMIREVALSKVISTRSVVEAAQ